MASSVNVINLFPFLSFLYESFLLIVAFLNVGVLVKLADKFCSLYVPHVLNNYGQNSQSKIS